MCVRRVLFSQTDQLSLNEGEHRVRITFSIHRRGPGGGLISKGCGVYISVVEHLSSRPLTGGSQVSVTFFSGLGAHRRI